MTVNMFPLASQAASLDTVLLLGYAICDFDSNHEMLVLSALTVSCMMQKRRLPFSLVV
jgi:hypothetical protein